MKLNIANPSTGCQKMIEIEDEKKLRAFMDKRISAEVAADSLGDEFKGYVFRISGGNDKQGFPMKQGVLHPGRVRLLLKKGHSCFRERRTGERKRKSVRGCIVAHDLSVLNLVLVKKGDSELPGLTDDVKPRRLGPKRASKIRKLFNLSKEDDVRKYVIRREIPAKEGKKPKTKAPKIQRLVTPVVLQRKRRRLALKKIRTAKNKSEAAEYAKLLAQRRQEKRSSLLSKKHGSASIKGSERKSTIEKPAAKPAPAPAKPAEKPKAVAKAGAKTPAKATAKAPAKAPATKAPAAKAPAKAATKTPAKPVKGAKPAAKTTKTAKK